MGCVNVIGLLVFGNRLLMGYDVGTTSKRVDQMIECRHFSMTQAIDPLLQKGKPLERNGSHTFACWQPSEFTGEGMFAVSCGQRLPPLD